MSNKNIDKRLSQHTEQKGGNFLFDTEDITPEALEQKTRIISRESMNCITYYGVLDFKYDCENAREIKAMMLRCFIGFDGKGRTEAVQVLQQNFPKKVEVQKGSDLTDE